MKEEFGTQLESGALRFVRDLPGPIERVWSYLVDPEKRARWFCGGTMADEAGGKFTMAFDHDRLSHEPLPESHAELRGGIEMPGRITAIEPPRLIAFEGIGEDAEVRFELEEEGKRIRLIVTQMPLGDRNGRLGTSAGWHAHLGILADLLEERTPRGFWTEHEAARDHYEKVIN